ncbi:hypothetical protein GLX30_15010 [Streptomyces sp. Tu 2975]|uniref:hypothetical protein n=1 Tax=Streptomyces sp. Tu 2975 TaxID=2676871 RepID=UPI001356A66F|nr:hypothetical protein [Streptomyces sp. Tu 2975]QIP85119.1 hypothetical protein GLX30_15010 [Streptomyces sp. Tu 2975]
MPASEREAQSRQQPSRPTPATPLPSAVSMRDLLASCAAASAVSTPPRDNEAHRENEARRPATHRTETHRDAA